MKKTIILTQLVIGLMMFAACSSNDGGSSPSDGLPNYTVMLYGCGGGNLDQYYIRNFKQCLLHGKTDNLNMTCLFKLSKALKDTVDVGTMKGAARYVLTEKQDTTGLDFYRYPAETIGDDSYPLYKSESLTDFIKWNVQNYPAKNYIIILWNHGAGWSAKKDTLSQSRSVIFDDNVDDKSMSLDEFTYGVKNAGIHLKAIHSEACLMGLYENMGNYADVADFFTGSTESSPNIGSNYDWLLDAIEASENDDDKYYKNMSDLTDSMCNYWYKYCPLDPGRDNNEELTDMMAVNLKKLDIGYSAIKDIVSELVASKDVYQPYDKEYKLKPQTYVMSYPFVDSKDYFDKLAAASGSEKLKTLADKYTSVIPEYAHISVVHPDYEETPRTISIGFILTNKLIYSSTNMGKAYELLNFDKATKWSDWLKIRTGN